MNIDVNLTESTSVQPTPIQQVTSIDPINGGSSISKSIKIILILVLVVMVGVSIYLIDARLNKSGRLNNRVDYQTPLPTLVISQPPSPTLEVTDSSENDKTSELAVISNSLSNSWVYMNNGECGVQFAIPPKAEPYYQPTNANRQPSVTDDGGRFWDFPRGNIYPNLLSKLPSGYEQHKGAIATYATESEASGYISSAVSVLCIPNNNNIDNTTMLRNLSSGINTYNQSSTEKGMGADTFEIISSKTESRWGHTVVDLQVTEFFSNSGGQPYTNSTQYTIFASPKYLYEVRKLGATESSFVKETASQIFESLVFE